MKKKHWIRVENRQRTGGESHQIKNEAACAFLRKGDTFYLLYEEKDGTKITVKIRGTHATLLRGHSRLDLEQGTRHSCLYETGYGTLPLETAAQRVEHRVTFSGGTARLLYDLWYQESLLSHNTVTITVTEQDSMKKDG